MSSEYLIVRQEARIESTKLIQTGAATQFCQHQFLTQSGKQHDWCMVLTNTQLRRLRTIDRIRACHYSDAGIGTLCTGKCLTCAKP